jgi:hypothetical protein
MLVRIHFSGIYNDLEEGRHPVNASYGAIVRSLEAVEKWIEKHHYRGYEPFDGLTSFLLPLTMNVKQARQALLQGVRRSRSS